MFSDNPHTQQALSIVTYGVSTQLNDDFSLLRETKEYSGTSDKFFDKSVDLVARNLICRNYGSLCYELSHLCWAIIHHAPNSNLLDFFWLQNTHTPSGFAHYFKKSSEQIHLLEQAKIVFEEQTLTITLFKQKFSIHASRANVLSCFMEWLVASLSKVLEKIEKSLFGEGVNAIKQVSSMLQKLIYAYLSEHLPSAKLQRRLRLMDSFYRQNQASNLSSLTNQAIIIDDESILAFWQKYKNVEGHSKYQGVLEESLTYKDAIEELRNSQSINSVFSAGQFNVEGMFSAEQLSCYLSSTENESVDFDSLLNAPKALTKQQYSLIKLLSSHLGVLMFPESWLRAMCFGQVQNSLLQSIRQKQPININATISEEADYQQIVTQVYLLLDHNNDTLLSIIALLQRIEPLAALSIMQVTLKADKRFLSYANNLAQHLDNEQFESVNDVLAIIEGQLWFKEISQQATNVLNKNNRKGFTSKTVLSASSYIDCAQQLLRLNKYLQGLVLNVKNLGLDSPDKYFTDRLIFNKEFSQLYKQGAQ